MEPAAAGQALSRRASGGLRGGRRSAALLLFGGCAALAGCAKPFPARVADRWRIGLGADALAVSGDGGRLAVACARSNDVWLLDLPDGGFIARVDTRIHPRALLFDPGGRGFYVAAGVTSVALIGQDGDRVVDEYGPPLPISGFAVDPASGRLFCAQAGLPVLGVYRPSDLHLESGLPVGGEVEAVRFDGPEAWLATRRAGSLVRVSLKRMSVEAQAYAGPDPSGLELDPEAGLAYVSCFGGESGEALPPAQVDFQDQSPTALLDLDSRSEPAGPSPPSDGGVAVLRLSDTRRVDYLPVPGGPLGMALSPSRRLLALDCADGLLRFLDLKARVVASSLDLGGRPGAMLALPDGRLAVALRDQKAVVVIAPGSGWD